MTAGRSVTGMSVSGTWNKCKLVGGFITLRIIKRTTTKEEPSRHKNSCMVALGNTCSCLLDCVFALCCLVNTNALLYVHFAVLWRAGSRLVCCAWLVPSLRHVSRRRLKRKSKHTHQFWDQSGKIFSSSAIKS